MISESQPLAYRLISDYTQSQNIFRETLYFQVYTGKYDEDEDDEIEIEEYNDSDEDDNKKSKMTSDEKSDSEKVNFTDTMDMFT